MDSYRAEKQQHTFLMIGSPPPDSMHSNPERIYAERVGTYIVERHGALRGATKPLDSKSWK